MENIQAKQKKKKGFTLIELIIVMAILGILALIAIPKFGQARKDAKVNADFASAKTIANTTSALLASEKITLDKSGKTEITLPIDEKVEKSANVKAILDRLSNSETMGKPQACTQPFVITIENGDVKVTVNKIQLYPEQNKSYPDGIPDTKSPEK